MYDMAYMENAAVMDVKFECNEEIIAISLGRIPAPCSGAMGKPPELIYCIRLKHYFALEERTSQPSFVTRTRSSILTPSSPSM